MPFCPLQVKKVYFRFCSVEIAVHVKQECFRAGRIMQTDRRLYAQIRNPVKQLPPIVVVVA